MALIQQNTPVECGVYNRFTGTMVIQASGNSRSAALSASVQDLQNQRSPLIAADQAMVCPIGCPGGQGTQITVGLGGVQSVEVNPDNGLWVAQHYGHWMVGLGCQGNYSGNVLVPSESFVVERHEEPLVCGKTRRSLGCVIAKAIDSSSLRARNAVKRLSRDERNNFITEDENKRCPAPCAPDPITSSKSGYKLIMARELKQARNGNNKTFVAYAIAWWSVEHKCIAVKAEKEEKNPEVEYTDPEGVETYETR